MCLSLLNFETGKDGLNRDLPKAPSLGVVQLAGIGAIRNAAVWALVRTGKLSCTLDLIDPQVIELSNLQRYVLATRADEGASKVELAKANFPADGKLVVHAHPLSWADFAKTSCGHPFDLVAAPMDTDQPLCTIMS